MKKKIRFTFRSVMFIGVLLCINCSLTFSQPNEPLPSDPAVIKGKLANGLTYYIRHNKKPENRAMLMLANKVGSILEEDHEQGLAHFTEHMAFKGTKNFPGNSIIEYLQEKGIRFGADLNAYTGFDQTVYHFPIQTDDPELMSQGFQILRDWAGDLLMEADAIDSERGVILEEKRQRNNVQYRVLENTLPIIARGSKYPTRMPIGTEEVLANFDHEVIRSFYKKWYRPDLQAVIAVGDFDVEEVRARIEQLFGDLQVPEGAPKRQTYEVSLDNTNEYLKYTDDEISLTSIDIMHRYAFSPIRTKLDQYSSLSLLIFNNLINLRLSDLTKQADPPFLSASIQIGAAFEGIGAARIRCVTAPGKHERGLQALYTELHRVRTHGFTDTEIERMKNSIMQNQQNVYDRRREVTSESLANVYLANFLNDDVYPDSEHTYSFYKKYLPTVTAAEINAHVAKFFTGTDRDVLVLGPVEHANLLPTEDDIFQLVHDVFSQPIEAYVDVDLSAPLLPEIPSPGTIAEEAYDARLGTTTLTLSNGVKVVLKPTSFQEDGLLIDAFSKGGTAVYDESQFDAAINAAGVVSRSGVGTYGADALPKKLSGKSVRVTPYINEYFEGFSAQSTRKDLETAFQLIHLFHVSPRVDTEVIDGILSVARENIKNRYRQSLNVLRDTVSNILHNYHWRKLPRTLEQIDQIDPQKGLEIFKERFANAGDFTYVITGNFEIDSIRPLLTTYLASLPAEGQKEEIQDIGLQRNFEPLRKVIYKGKEDKATIQLILNGSHQYEYEVTRLFNTMETILQYRIFERLRNQESSVYSPSVSVQQIVLPTPYYEVNISVSTDPQRVDAVVGMIKEELERLAEEGPTEAEIQKVISESLVSLENSVKQDAYWHRRIRSQLQHDEDPALILKNEEIIKSLTVEKMQAFLRDHLDVSRLKEFILLPEATEE